MRLFLRKFSHRFFSGNGFTNYTLYAIGEILFVVVGILIAVQVNNWNTLRKQNNKEKVYIEEIKHSLNRDLTKINSVREFNVAKDSCIEIGLRLLGESISNSERVRKFYELLNTIGYYQWFKPDDVAFKNMISTETIDIIQDDSLKRAVSGYYRDEMRYEWETQERAKELTRKFIDEISPLIVCNEIASVLTNPELDFQYGNADQNEFHKEKFVFSSLYIMKTTITSQNILLEYSEEKISEILSHISRLE